MSFFLSTAHPHPPMVLPMMLPMMMMMMMMLLLVPWSAWAATSAGSWHLLVENSGVSAMHMTLTHQNTVIIFDRTDYGPSQLRLPNGRCRDDPNDLALTHDCYAHSIEYSIAQNTFRPLEVLSDTWCSSGAFLSDGTLLSTGGYNDGAKAVRRFYPCAAPGGTCDWNEAYPAMGASRWYASNQILPDGSVIVVGGRGSFSYEFVPSRGNPIPLQLLRETNLAGAEDNLYPFLHLSSDGNLFVFANQKSILLDYKNNRVVRTYPDIPGGPRNYPSSGSSVILPLVHNDGFKRVEVLICGGSPPGGYEMANSKRGQVSSLTTCGRLVITDPNPQWAMESMPSPRVMGDMLILPTGEVLVVNGAKTGAAGWLNAANPNQNPLLYRPTAAAGGRFQVLAGSGIPRLYHSTANLLPDGRVLVGGSNPNVGYAFAGVPFKTELRLEAYHPYYLDDQYNNVRPKITGISKGDVGYGGTFTVAFSVPSGRVGTVEYRIYAPPFTTHTYSMNQRQLVLAATPATQYGARFLSTVTAPPSSVAAPAGHYLLFVVNSGIPSQAAWVRFH